MEQNKSTPQEVYRLQPIGLTTCMLLNVDEANGIVDIASIDAFEGTPVLDLKAYFPVCDRVKDAQIPEWLTEWPEWMPDEGLMLYEEYEEDEVT